jgi:hypothetical protein
MQDTGLVGMSRRVYYRQFHNNHEAYFYLVNLHVQDPRLVRMQGQRSRRGDVHYHDITHHQPCASTFCHNNLLFANFFLQISRLVRWLPRRR